MFPYLSRRISRFQSTMVVLAACCVVMQTAYLPLPITVQKDLSVAFPCQAKGCGCQNAQQCWESCCCHTDLEKLAWAKQHDVTPPIWFLGKIEMSLTDFALETCSVGNATAGGAESKSSCCCCAASNAASDVALCWKQIQDCRGQDSRLTHQELLFVTPPAEWDLVTFSVPFQAMIELPLLLVGTPPPSPPPDLMLVREI